MNDAELLFKLSQNDDNDSSFVKSLTLYKSSWDEPSWNTTKIEMFKRAVELEFSKDFPYKYKITWDRESGINGEHVLNMTVNTLDWGQISSQLNVEMIKNNKYPKTFHIQLKDAFKKKFLEKIENIKSKLQKARQEEINKKAEAAARLAQEQKNLPKPEPIKIPAYMKRSKKTSPNLTS